MFLLLTGVRYDFWTRVHLTFHLRFGKRYVLTVNRSLYHLSISFLGSEISPAKNQSALKCWLDRLTSNRLVNVMVKQNSSRNHCIMHYYVRHCKSWLNSLWHGHKPISENSSLRSAVYLTIGMLISENINVRLWQAFRSPGYMAERLYFVLKEITLKS